MSGYRAPAVWRRVTGADLGSWTDVNSMLSGAVTDDGVSVNIPMLGSKLISNYGSTPHPKNGAWAVFPLIDLWGNPVTGDVDFGVEFRISFASVPSINDNVMAMIGIVNESDLTSGTIDGLMDAADFTAATGNPRVRNWLITNGGISNAIAGSTAAAVAGVRSHFSRIKGGAGALFTRILSNGINSSLNFASGANAVATTATVVDGNTTQKYGYLSLARTAAADTDPITASVVLEYMASGAAL